MGVLSKKLIAGALSLSIVIGFVYVNRMPLMTWVVAQGAMGYMATLAEPILPSQPVDWQTSQPVPNASTDRPPNIIVILADDLG